MKQMRGRSEEDKEIPKNHHQFFHRLLDHAKLIPPTAISTPQDHTNRAGVTARARKKRLSLLQQRNRYYVLPHL